VAPRNKAITDSLASSALLQIVDERNAEALLKRQDDDTWVLVDDIHGAKLDYPVLCRVNADQLGLAARLMEQYYYYSLPLRMVESCIDLPGALQLNLLNCPVDRPLSVTEQDGIGLPEVESGAEFTYELHVGDKVAIRIRNSSKERLKVTLLNSAGSGRVEYLGEQIIDAKAHFIFWRANTRGEPFPATTPKGVDQGIDRLVAIGTTAYDKDLRYFKLDSRFADILESTRSGVAKDLYDIDSMSPPLEQWTTCHAVLRCRA
jgi:hypothetical protein